MKNQLPDRPIPEYLKFLRNIIRWKRKALIKLRLRSKISWGENVQFGKRLELRPPEFMRIANNVSVGPWFLTESNVDIGSDVLISSKVSFVGNDHDFNDPNATIFFSKRLPPSTVVLEGDNLIGYGSIVVGNVRIGKGCIVGAGSVVVKDLPANFICAGVPAKPIRKRHEGK